MHCAALQKDPSLIKVLVDLGADIERRNNDGLTPLLVAARNIKLELVRMLLHLGADIHVVDYLHRSALHLSTYYGSYSAQVTDLLLSKGACPDSSDLKGMTPMHYSILTGSKETAKLLIQAELYVNACIKRRHWDLFGEAARRLSVFP